MHLRRQIGKAIRAVLGASYTRLRAGNENAYLRRVRGVIHVGANTGQERDLYAAFGLNVVWIEPIPEVYRVLQTNIAGLPKQRALNYLVMDEDGKEFTLYISDNEGASSSVLDFSKHVTMWPDIHFIASLVLKAAKLATILQTEGVEIEKFNALVLDTQGTELRILTGSSDLLRHFKFIKVEVSDFESYQGCCQINELSSFLHSYGFRESQRIPFRHMDNVGTYFDVIYERDE